jgi:RNA polymerase sigma factor (sigma-70 family)
MSPSVSVRLLLTQSDTRLAEFARAGHERAFEALVQRYRRPLLGYCRRLLLSDERAEDALQQAFLQAWLALRAGTDVGDVKPWLYRIVYNAALNALRMSGYDYCKLSESLSGADAPYEDLDRRIAVREALAGLAALPEMQREALLRTAVEGGTHRQVARELGLSEPALRGLVYRARAALRAAAGAVIPSPLVSWALGSGGRGAPVIERLAELGAGGGSAGVAGLLMKGGAVAVTASVLAGGIAAVHPRARATHRHTSSHAAADRVHPTTAPLALTAARVADMASTPTTQLRHPSHPEPHSMHQPPPQPRRVLPRPRTMPFTTAIAPPVPGPTDPHRGNGRSDGGGHDQTQSPESRGPPGVTATGVATIPSEDGAHDSGHAEQGSDGGSSHHGGQDGGSPAGSTTSGASSDSGSGHEASGSDGSPSEGPTNVGQLGESHNLQGSPGASSPTRTNSSSKDERASTLTGPKEG